MPAWCQIGDRVSSGRQIQRGGEVGTLPTLRSLTGKRNSPQRLTRRIPDGPLMRSRVEARLVEPDTHGLDRNRGAKPQTNLG